MIWINADSGLGLYRALLERLTANENQALSQADGPNLRVVPTVLLYDSQVLELRGERATRCRA